MVPARLDILCRRTHGHSRPLDIRVPLLQHNTGCERNLGAWDHPLPRTTQLQKVGLLLGVFSCYQLYVRPRVHSLQLQLVVALHSPLGIPKRYSNFQQYADHRCASSRTLQNKKTAERCATGSLKLLYDEVACFFLYFTTTNCDCWLFLHDLGVDLRCKPLWI